MGADAAIEYSSLLLGGAFVVCVGARRATKWRQYREVACLGLEKRQASTSARGRRRREAKWLLPACLGCLVWLSLGTRSPTISLWNRNGRLKAGCVVLAMAVGATVERRGVISGTFLLLGERAGRQTAPGHGAWRSKNGAWRRRLLGCLLLL